MTLEDQIVAQLKKAREASRTLALCSTERKNAVLLSLAKALKANSAGILEANRKDLEIAKSTGRTGAFLERLTLNDARIASMAKSVEEVAALPDPVGELIERWSRPNGLQIQKVRVPLGVIAIIYESRPNVTIDAGVLIFKSGSAVVLRGGKEALAANTLLAKMLARSLEEGGVDPAAVQFIDTPDREAIQILKRHPEAIDLIIPRGGESLKEALAGSAVPLLPHFDGKCHTYVDRAADLKMAEEICFNAKVSRPSVCNAMEKLLVHREVAAKFLPSMAKRLIAVGVELRGDEATCAIIGSGSPNLKRATEEDWDAEYLDLILSIKIVDSIDEAIAFIARHGSGLADAIVTQDGEAAARFEREVDSATVYVNASTRFTDGFEFGFGAETGISTNRLHARGPMGLRELTTYKYLVRGEGQIRK
jgi:glutamate-5-semialdehyde dehydrogenase